jgi:nicotinamidase-related amidase
MRRQIVAFDFFPSGTVDVPDIPVKEQVTLRADETALVIVDMQNDFIMEKGSLRVPAAGETIGNIQRLGRSARAAGVHIAYTKDTHFEHDKEWDIWPEHCRRNTWGWEIVEELTPRGSDLVCEKNRYDGFYGTWLEHYLGNVWHVRNLVVVGTVANICVLHTAASAGVRWFHIVVPANGISALTPFDQALALRQVTSLYAGEVVRSVNDIRFV